jgi:hypothetical protein
LNFENKYSTNTRVERMAASSGEKLNLENDIKRAIELLEKLQRTEYNAWISRFYFISLLIDL